MRPIDELQALNPADPVEAQEAIDEAIAANQQIDTQVRIDLGRRAAQRTAISPGAIRLAKRP
ncbi:hypothetical protein [Caulobacter sp. CCG-8]|uniref:hypothetical protein n=1 Tax=Caulobacter sp. CCG-8 TaxID=3127958 RepID=UPI00307DE134